MTGKELGMALDFYRLRVIQVDAGDLPDLEWREDILYRDPPASEPEECDAYVVQAVDLDADDSVMPLASFSDHAEAHGWLEEAEVDLRNLTRSEFELRYFPRGPRTPAQPDRDSSAADDQAAG